MQSTKVEYSSGEGEKASAGHGCHFWLMLLLLLLLLPASRSNRAPSSILPCRPAHNTLQFEALYCRGLMFSSKHSKHHIQYVAGVCPRRCRGWPGHLPGEEGTTWWKALLEGITWRKAPLGPENISSLHHLLLSSLPSLAF